MIRPYNEKTRLWKNKMMRWQYDKKTIYWRDYIIKEWYEKENIEKNYITRE